MTEPRKPIVPHPGKLMARIRVLAAEGKLSFTSHALDERMPERGIDAKDVLDLLSNGEIEGEVQAGNRKSEWRCLVVGNLEWSSRNAGVVTIVVRDERLIVVTVEWMDRR
jgi:hypothetical protein